MEAGTDVTLHLTSLPELHGPVDLTMPAMSTDAHVDGCFFCFFSRPPTMRLAEPQSITLPPTAAPFGDTT